MKIKYEIKPWQGKVPLGSRFCVKHDTSRKYIRKEKGWMNEESGEFCSHNGTIDDNYLEGSYQIIK